MKNKPSLFSTLVILFVAGLILFCVFSFSFDGQYLKEGTSDPVHVLAIMAVNVVVGAILYAIGAWMEGAWKPSKNVLKIIGLWNVFWGVLIQIATLLRLVFTH